jgi:Xaa-Pro aminopeptidase
MAKLDTTSRLTRLRGLMKERNVHIYGGAVILHL